MATSMDDPRLMQRADTGGILMRLADEARRPRYAFMVLNLISEVADERGEAGPFVGRLPIRDWLCQQLMPLSGRGERRRKLRAAVCADMAPARDADAIGGLFAGLEEDREAEREAEIEQAVHDRALAVGKTNVSRAVTELVRAGFVRRHYAGWCKDHQNRGGGRRAVYTVAPDILAVLRRGRA